VDTIERRELYPEIEPFARGELALDQRHVMHCTPPSGRLRSPERAVSGWWCCSASATRAIRDAGGRMGTS
jgi:hypothetical protein